MLEKGEAVSTTHAFFLSNLAITPLEGSVLVTLFSYFCLFHGALRCAPGCSLGHQSVPVSLHWVIGLHY